MPECISCHETGKKQYYMVKSLGFKCSDCVDGVKQKQVENKQHLPIWPRWKCLTHDCGSYNFNMLTRHEMPWCDITKEYTIGIIKPNTFGGHKGNVGRHYFKDWHEFVNRHDTNIKEIKTWRKTQRMIGRTTRNAYISKRL